MGSFKHIFVPKHEVASQKEVDEMCKKYGITVDKLPLIKLTDPALEGLEVVPGQVIKVMRKSAVTGKEESYYRKVVED
ncbi:MAG: DNA-directed RNA polymerase subunit RpoH/Rpb5 C-terminal domain-containing protein [Candidatus Micrarchaeia archaeon]|jgi:DNA-directed RNA polymerase subunit H